MTCTLFLAICNIFYMQNLIEMFVIAKFDYAATIHKK